MCKVFGESGFEFALPQQCSGAVFISPPCMLLNNISNEQHPESLQCLVISVAPSACIIQTYLLCVICYQMTH